MLRCPETPKVRIEPTTLHVKATNKAFPTRLGTLYYCCYEFNVICGESPRHTSFVHIQHWVRDTDISNKIYNLVEWEVSVPAVRVVVVSTLSIFASALPIEMTLFMGALFMYLIRCFWNQKQAYILGYSLGFSVTWPRWYANPSILSLSRTNNSTNLVQLMEKYLRQCFLLLMAKQALPHIKRPELKLLLYNFNTHNSYIPINWKN